MRHEKIITISLLILFLFSTVACGTTRQLHDKDAEKYNGYRTMVTWDLISTLAGAFAKAEKAAALECESEGKEYMFLRRSTTFTSIEYICRPIKSGNQPQEFIAYGAAKPKKN